MNTQNAKARRAKILIVENYGPMNSFLCEVLSLEHEVISTQTISEGCQLANEFLPELVICDLFLPDGNGEQFIAELHHKLDLASIPVIAISTMSDEQIKSRLLDLGFCDYFTKPFNLKDFLTRVRTISENRLQSEDKKVVISA